MTDFEQNIQAKLLIRKWPLSSQVQPNPNKSLQILRQEMTIVRWRKLAVKREFSLQQQFSPQRN
jgi:hypothetical protein